MQAYRFVGSNCVIHGVAELSKFGQRIELPNDLAETVIRGGGAIIPEHEFEAIGFTADELKKYEFPGARVNAPQSFKDKFTEANKLFCEKHYELDRESYRFPEAA